MDNHNSKTYISHLDGLRAIAILMVVFFHIYPNTFSHGYVGVDIFFVISGFLLFRSLDFKHTFYFWSFIKKKVVRLIPSLACLLIIAGICASPVLFSEGDITVLGSSILYSLAGVSNRYYQTLYADYFSPGANMNPLLHTWYLAVLLQIYAIWAISCWLLTRLPQRIFNFSKQQLVIVFVALIAFSSFLYTHSNIIQAPLKWFGIPTWEQFEEISYYSTFSRVWQIAAGASALFLPQHRLKIWVNTTLATIGLVLILFTGCSNFSHSPFCSIITVLSTILLIRYTANTSINRILNIKWLQRIGQISFSLYLVHFPIIVIYKRWEKLMPDLFSGLILFFLAIALAWVLWHTIEKRKWNFLRTLLFFATTFVTGIFFKYNHKLGSPMENSFNFAYPVYAIPSECVPKPVYNGYNHKMLKANRGTSDLIANKPNDRPMAIMPLGRPRNPEFVLIGDSNAQHLYAGMHEMCKEKSLQGIHLTTIIVPFTNRFVYFNDPGYNWDKDKSLAIYTWLNQHPEIHTVVISQLWSRLLDDSYVDWQRIKQKSTFNENAEKLRCFCSYLKRMGKHVVLVMPSPRFFSLNKDLHGTGLEYARWIERRGNKTFNLNNEKDPFVLTKKQYVEYYEQVLNLFTEWEEEGFCSVLHIEKSMFKDGNYTGIKNGVLYCRDSTHITPSASIELIQGVSDDFESLIIIGRQLQQTKDKIFTN